MVGLARAVVVSSAVPVYLAGVVTTVQQKPMCAKSATRARTGALALNSAIAMNANVLHHGLERTVKWEMRLARWLIQEHVTTAAGVESLRKSAARDRVVLTIQ
jgi:hypothetical protein